MENKSSFKSILSSKAEKEITSSWDWYEERQPGLGDKFAEEVIKCIRKIEENPDRYVSRGRNFKEVLLSVFPFLIIYTG